MLSQELGVSWRFFGGNRGMAEGNPATRTISQCINVGDQNLSGVEEVGLRTTKVGQVSRCIVRRWGIPGYGGRLDITKLHFSRSRSRP
jgi:hypothetical protein